MSGTTSIVRAEERALAGNNESQDSEQVLEAYQRMYGIGLMSSSPPQDDEALVNKLHKRVRKTSQGAEGRKKAVKSRVQHPARSVQLPLEDTETRNALFNDREATTSLPLEFSASARRFDKKIALKAPGPSVPPENPSGDVSAGAQPKPCADKTRKQLSVPSALNLVEPNAANGKMDSSQSPTQSNHGRDYDRYFPASSHSDKAAADRQDLIQAVATHSLSSTYEQRSLMEDDTGAVVFDEIENHAPVRNDNSLPSDQSPELARPSVRTRTFALQRHDSQSQDQAPETPAVRSNPFAGNNNFQLLPTSQLFKATQFSSAVRRGASPTSSRPSPHDFPYHTISPNPVSSPLKARGLRSSPSAGNVSSPQVNHTTDSPRPGDEHATPLNTASAEEPVVPESPHYRPPKARAAPAPMDVYVPMRQSQERRSTSVVLPGTASPELSDDGDDPINRRRRARSKKEASLKRLTSIQFTRTPKPEDVEVPGTNSKRRKSRMSAQYINQCNGTPSSDEDSQVQDVVENSQDQLALLEKAPLAPLNHQEELTQSSQGVGDVSVDHRITRSSAASSQPGPRRQRGKGLIRRNSTQTTLANGETIPETSPIEKQSMRFLDPPGATPTAPSKAPPNHLGFGSPRTMKATNDLTGAPKSSVAEYVPPAPASFRTGDNGAVPATPIVISSTQEEGTPRGVEISPLTLPDLKPNEQLAPPSSPPAPAFSTRSKTRPHEPPMEDETPAVPSSKELPNANTSVSTLSALSATPSLTSSTTTPGSQGSRGSRKSTGDTDEASPAVAKNKRRRIDDLPQLKPASTMESLRASKRLSRQHRLDSTDELAKSPSMTPTFEQSLRVPTRNSLSRFVRTGTADLQVMQGQSHRRPGKLFDRMAFAVSFQAQKPGESDHEYAERENAAGRLGKKISQAGGKVLEHGFEELFGSGSVGGVTSSPAGVSSSSPLQLDDGEVTLTAAARRLGFTALVADGHSRKPKYMQALALGLPCIAAKWITACLDRNEIVDWAPYLLCAGQSKFLDGAYRSRTLTPYDASQARLAQVIEARPRLLDGNKVLLVMKKAEQGKKLAYVFLARILGATLCRAHSTGDARAQVKAAQESGEPFDWVYADGKAGKAELYTDGAADTGANNKKRKRAVGWVTIIEGAPMKKTRTLTDELVIQSLILGRLIEDGEMKE